MLYQVVMEYLSQGLAKASNPGPRERNHLGPVKSCHFLFKRVLNSLWDSFQNLAFFSSLHNCHHSWAQKAQVNLFHWLFPVNGWNWQDSTTVCWDRVKRMPMKWLSLLAISSASDTCQNAELQKSALKARYSAGFVEGTASSEGIIRNLCLISQTFDFHASIYSIKDSLKGFDFSWQTFNFKN